MCVVSYPSRPCLQPQFYSLLLIGPGLEKVDPYCLHGGGACVKAAYCINCVSLHVKSCFPHLIFYYRLHAVVYIIYND